jgi:hypothetical protein
MRRLLLLFPLLAAMVGCADGATDPTTTGSAAIRAALLIDPDALPRYAGVVLPAYYDAVVLGR